MATVTLMQAASQTGASYQTLFEAVRSKSLTTVNGTVAPPFMVDLDTVKAWLKTNKPSIAATIKRSEFIARFTDAEKVAAATTPQTLVWWLQLMDMPVIDLSSALVIADVNGLVTANILTADRAALILHY